MLIVSFKIAVEVEYEKRMFDMLVEEYGVEITNVYYEEVSHCWSVPKKRVYFECYCPYTRFQPLVEDFNTETKMTAILFLNNQK